MQGFNRSVSTAKKISKNKCKSNMALGKSIKKSDEPKRSIK